MSVKGMINDAITSILDSQFNAKKKLLEQKNLSPHEYSEQLAILAREFDQKSLLIDLSYDEEYFADFYDDFCELCFAQKPSLTYEEIDHMFINLIKEIYETKIKMFDAHSSANIPDRIAHVKKVEHEGATRVVWTQAQQKASDELRQKLDAVFEPLLKDYEKKKVSLYIKEGADRAETIGAAMHIEHAPSVIYNDLVDYFADILYSQAFDVNSFNYEADYTLSILLWHAFSMHYVLNDNGKDIDVFLPDGEIPTSSIFWNYELNEIRKMELAANNTGRHINFHRLTEESKKEIIEFRAKLKTKEAESKQLYKELKTEVLPEKITELTDRITKLESEINDLYDKKYKIGSSEKSWQTVPFEELKIKGLKARNQDFTIGNLIKVADQMKKIVANRKEKREKIVSAYNLHSQKNNEQHKNLTNTDPDQKKKSTPLPPKNFTRHK